MNVLTNTSCVRDALLLLAVVNLLLPYAVKAKCEGALVCRFADDNKFLNGSVYLLLYLYVSGQLLLNQSVVGDKFVKSFDSAVGYFDEMMTMY